MKCLILFSGKNKKTLMNLSSAKSAHSMVSAKNCIVYQTALKDIKFKPNTDKCFEFFS